MEHTDATKILMGRVVATPGALAVLEDARESSLGFLMRHAAGDWGDVPPEDWEENEFSVAKELRVISTYSLRTGMKLMIITEADRSLTTILLPDEY